MVGAALWHMIEERGNFFVGGPWKPVVEAALFNERKETSLSSSEKKKDEQNQKKNKTKQKQKINKTSFIFY